MSRAFIKEDADGSEPERRPPSGPNYVTPRGLDLLRKRVRDLEGRKAGMSEEEKRDLRYWEGRLATAVPVDSSRTPPADIRFGALVEVRERGGRERRFRIVGQDEAELGGDLVSWDSVPARALIGRRPGETASWPEGDSEVSVEVVSLTYPAS